MRGFLLKVPHNLVFSSYQQLFVDFPLSITKYDNEWLEIVIWGDPIFKGNFNSKPEEISTPENLIRKFSGHYFYLILNKRLNYLYIGNSLFSILPLYYYQAKEFLFISSSPGLINQYASDTFTISGQFILEKLLFNYPFNNCSLYESISCLESNSYLKITNKSFKELKHTNIVEWFTDSPIEGKNVLSSLSDIFIEQIKQYLPDEHYYISFTSGFDGRTLLASSLFYNKEFTAYSFGKAGAEDILLPHSQSKQLNINYVPILLDNEDYLNEALNCGKEFTSLSNGNGNWARAHYLYAAKIIGKKSKYLVTGNFGSELFRAFHNPGVMITPFLYDLINSRDKESIINNIENRPELKYIHYSNFKAAFSKLKDDLVSYFNQVEELDKNHILYKFILEEVFRKYFGAELYAQSSFTINRTPFLDPVFVKQLFKTGYAGIYSNFFENNPLKRFKGQLLYAYILRKTNNQLYTFKTGKGYRPNDLLSFYGQLRIANSYFCKKLKITNETIDPFAVQDVYNSNKDQLLKINFNNDYFNSNELKYKVSETTHFDNTLINYITLNWLTESNNAKI